MRTESGHRRILAQHRPGQPSPAPLREGCTPPPTSSKAWAIITESGKTGLLHNGRLRSPSHLLSQRCSSHQSGNQQGHLWLKAEHFKAPSIQAVISSRQRAQGGAAEQLGTEITWFVSRVRVSQQLLEPAGLPHPLLGV